jgi:hypothetical protein
MALYKGITLLSFYERLTYPLLCSVSQARPPRYLH